MKLPALGEWLVEYEERRAGGYPVDDAAKVLIRIARTFADRHGVIRSMSAWAQGFTSRAEAAAEHREAQRRCAALIARYRASTRKEVA